MTAEATIARGDRVVILGRTGSGKSVALRSFLGDYSRAVLVDPKGRAAMPGWPTTYGLAQFRATWPRTAARVVARAGAGEDRRAWFDGVLRWIYDHGETAVGVDEIIGLASDSRPSTGLDMVLTQGRELGITCFVATQRPRRIPATVLSECDHVIAYTLQRPADVEYVADVIGEYQNPRFGTYRFVYWSGRLTSSIESAPVRPGVSRADLSTGVDRDANHA